MLGFKETEKNKKAFVTIILRKKVALILWGLKFFYIKTGFLIKKGKRISACLVVCQNALF